VVLSAPIVAYGLFFVIAIAGGLVSQLGPPSTGAKDDLANRAGFAAALVLTLAVAAMASLLGRYSALDVPVVTAVVVMVPVAAALLYYELDSQRLYLLGAVDPSARHPLTGGILLWAGGLLVILALAGTARRRPLLAWSVGIVGALAVIAVTVIVVQRAAHVPTPIPLPQLPFYDLVHEAGPSAVWDPGYTLYMLICSGYALGYTLPARAAALRGRRIMLPAPA
jgi:hypothetical protein